MTDKKEIEGLKAKIEDMGGRVSINEDSEGWIDNVTIIGIKGIGTMPMSPIFAAERMRKAIYEHSNN